MMDHRLLWTWFLLLLSQGQRINTLPLVFYPSFEVRLTATGHVSWNGSLWRFVYWCFCILTAAYCPAVLIFCVALISTVTVQFPGARDVLFFFYPLCFSYYFTPMRPCWALRPSTVAHLLSFSSSLLLCRKAAKACSLSTPFTCAYPTFVFTFLCLL